MARALLCGLLLALGSSMPAQALGPDDLAVLANSRAPAGVEIAREYMALRGIPADRLLAAPMPETERCDRAAFETKIAGPLRRFLAERAANGVSIRCLVTVRGVPLRVDSPPPSGRDAERLASLDREIGRLREAGPGEAERGRLKSLENQRHDLRRRLDGMAAVDSELALVRRERYPVAGWLRNPLFPKFRGRRTAVAPEALLRVSRLDGPTPERIRERMAETLSAEKAGLRGVAYLDARWSEDSSAKGAYRRFDGDLHRTARFLRRRGWPVVLESTEALLGPGAAPNAALYCGWYQLSRYADAFSWTPGAIGYHVASGECTTLRTDGERIPWCPGMLADGAAAVIGPVGEPYLAAFPPPSLFFRKLLAGRGTLAEVYWESVPFLSWKMMLVGDPLYRPFAAEEGGSEPSADSGGLD
jgi:uncharacterized protein (TIGR03790 family)